MQDILLQASLYLVGGVIAVLIAHRLGLGSVLGYLLAGVAIAPVLEWAGSDAESLKHFVEYGVVIMLFLIGLELQPSLLWKMRGRLLGLGGLQVLITMGLVTGGAMAFGIDWRQAVAIGMILSLSSTAIVLQTLGEKGWMRTEGGQSSFSVLLFQDIAVIPMLAFLPLLAAPGGFPEDATDAAAHGEGHGEGHGADHGADYAAGHGGDHAGEGGHGAVTLISELPAWGQVGAILAAVALVILAGRYLSRPAFRLIARTGQREVFVAAALGLVIVTSLLMGAVGISAALGAFLAGVVLADSEYRPELEANLEPFKGLLLGVFFITVGASADFGLLQAQTALVLGLAFGLIALKAAVLFALTPIFSLKRRDRWMFVMGLAQAGEFGFVLISFSGQATVLPDAVSDILTLVITLSMLATPILFLLFEKVVAPMVTGAVENEREMDAIDDQAPVIIAGLGRFGQIVNRMLLRTGHRTVVLDHAADHIDGLRRFGVQAYYGDALRPDLLETAGIDKAGLLVCAIDDREKSVELVRWAKARHPHLPVIARAESRPHVYELRKAGAEVVVRELFHSSVEAGKAALKILGEHPFRVERMSRAFVTHDYKLLDELYDLWDEDTDIFSNPEYIERARSISSELDELMSQDRSDLHDRSERGWTPPHDRKGEGGDEAG